MTEDTKNQSDVFMAKGVTMVVLCFVSICMGLIPIQVARCIGSSGKKSPRSSTVVGMLLGFGGGVLLATTFLHMLPEVTEKVNYLVDHNKLFKINLPLTEIFVCLGFFLMYLVEELVHTRLRREQKKTMIDIEKDVNRSTNELVRDGQVSLSSHGTVPGCGHGHSHLPAGTINDHHDSATNSWRGLLIVLGLSVHELFEGLAIGLKSNANGVWVMFAAVAVHKFVIAFCIGVELIAAKTNRWLSIMYVCTFAIVSPMGIGIGMILVGGGGGPENDPIPVVLQALATGTLLYVVFFEILQHHRDGLHQYLSILIGFIVMAVLQCATHSHEGHSHPENSHDGHGHEDHSHEHHEHEKLITTTAAAIMTTIMGSMST